VADLTVLTPGTIYRLKPQLIGGRDYGAMYERGEFIYIRILSGPNPKGLYKATTRDEDGNHLGPGGGWKYDNDLLIRPYQVEEIPAAV
jgi:hypothetical protein